MPTPNAELRDTRLPLDSPSLRLLSAAARPLLLLNQRVAAKPSISEPYPDTLRTHVYSTSSVPGEAT
jgi:hypothetical protein